MCLRALWVLNASFAVQWSRRFPTVETRHRSLSNQRLSEFPDEDELGPLFKVALEEYHAKANVVAPVLVLPKSSVSPLVFAECTMGFVVVLPLCATPVTDASLLAHPSLAQAIDCASQLAAYLDMQVALQQQSSGHAFWASVSIAVSMAMPFGAMVRPLAAGEMLARGGLSARASGDETFDSSSSLSGGGAGQGAGSAASGGTGVASARAPAWRVNVPGASAPKKSRVAICIEETIESHQFDRAGGGGDSARLTGRVTLYSDCAAAPSLDVGMRISLPLQASPDDARLSCDPCVSVFTSTVSGKRKTVHLTAVPAIRTTHTVLRYECPPPATMPWRAFYQMKPGPGAKEAKVLIQLKLSEGVTNQFEGCYVIIPFGSTGGVVDSFEVSPTEGQVRRGADASTLVWELGSSVVGRKLECALPLTVRFVTDAISSNARWPCFADLSFRIVSSGSLSGVHVAAEDVQLFPKSNASVIVSALITSGVYRIWNSLG